MDCLEEREQMSVDKTLGTGSEKAAIKDCEEYVHTNLTSLLNQFLPPSNENIPHGTLENTQASVEDNVELRPPTKNATSVQYCESNVTLTEPNSSRPGPDMDITLASLLGYPNTKSCFEHQQSVTSENTTTRSARDIGMIQSLCGFESTPYICKLSRCIEPAYSSQVGNNESGLGLTEGNTYCNDSGESDGSESSPWWLNPESDISMADVHRAVSDFITGKEFCVQSRKNKEEFVPANNYDNSSLVWDPNCLENESTCSKFLRPNSVPTYGGVGDNDNVSIERNKSCVLDNRPEHRRNFSVSLLSDGSNTLIERDEKSRPTPSESSSLELTPLDPPMMVDNKWVDVHWIRNGVMYTCNICDKIYSQLEIVRDHVRTHLEIRPYACHDGNCREKFPSLYKLRLHMRNCHGLTSEIAHTPTVICLESDARVPSVSNIGCSLSDGNTCTQTNKSTCYPCLKCGKEFKHIQWLKQHEIVHNNITSYRCQSCGLNFRCNYDRYNHLKTCHYRSHFTRPLEQTRTNQDVTKHKNVVYIKKRFQCKECDQKFTKELFLTEHVCYSRGVDLYTCDICSDTFVQKSYLIRHLVRNHSPL